MYEYDRVNVPAPGRAEKPAAQEQPICSHGFTGIPRLSWRFWLSSECMS